MKISTSGKHIEVGESLTAHIETALKTLVKRQLGDVLEAQVTVSKDKKDTARIETIVLLISLNGED